jgi:hypothetical protein
MEKPIKASVLVARVLAGRAFLVKTPSCAQYYAKLKRWFVMGIQGAIVYGRPRLGKTSASRWVLGATQLVFGKVPYVEVPIRKQHLHNEGAFFQFMLKCCRHKYYNRGTVADKRDRLLEALLGRARRSSIRMVILFIDEAHELEELHYQWLRNISNELDMAGYRLFCLLVGQQELEKKRDSLLVEGMEQIVSRFMTEVWMFSGLKNTNDLRSVLNSYDIATYPADNGRPFVEYFVPLASAHGWKLEDLADKIWAEYESCWSALSINAPLEVGMQYVTSTVTSILEYVSARDKPDLVISDRAIQECVRKSGFSASAEILNSLKKVRTKRH